MSKKPYAYKRGRLNVSSKGKLPHAKKPTLRTGSEIGWIRSSLQKGSCFLRNTDQDWSAPEPSWLEDQTLLSICCSVTQSFPTICDPMDCSTLDFPVLHHLMELIPTPVHWVGDAIQPSHPLLSPSPPAPNPSQHQGLFQWVNSSHEVAKVLELQLQRQSFQWTPRTDLLEDWMVWSPCRPRDSLESSPTPQFKSINSSVLSFLYSPALIHTWLLEKPIDLTRRTLLAK